VRVLTFNRAAFGMCAAALLARCGGSQLTVGVPGATPQRSAVASHNRGGSRPADTLVYVSDLMLNEVATDAERGTSWMLSEAKRDDLLYVSSFTPEEGKNISVYSYPGGRLVGELDPEYAPGLCSDAAGNVFVVETNLAEIVEYAHGGTQPIATLSDEYNSPSGCAVDPTTGNLAVAGGNFPGYYVTANVAIFPHATGSPTVYYDYDDLTFSWCTYDDKGNLFVNGRNFDKGASNLAELPVGGSTFSQVSVQNANVHGNGSIQWDDQYLAIAKVYPGDNKKGPATIYQLQISGQNGKAVNTIELQGSHVSDRNGWSTQQFWIQDHRIISPESANDRVGLWDYPGGGYAIRSKVQAPYTPLGLAVSLVRARH
jgi:hypothetical protein